MAFFLIIFYTGSETWVHLVRCPQNPS